MKFLNKINSFIHGLAGVMLGIMTTLIIAQVFFRFVLRQPLSSSEELARYSMIWLVMLASTVLLKNRTHIAVTYFAELSPPGFQKVLRIISYACILVSCTVFLIFGYELMIKTVNQISPASHISKAWVASAIPVFGFIGILYTLEHIIKEFKLDKETKQN